MTDPEPETVRPPDRPTTPPPGPDDDPTTPTTPPRSPGAGGQTGSGSAAVPDAPYPAPDRPTGEPAGPGAAGAAPGDAPPAARTDRSPGLRLSARVAQVAAREADTSAPDAGDSHDGPGGGSTGGGGRPGGGQGPRPPANWRRTLYALWFAQILALIAFSMRVPFLPFFLGDLGLEDTDDQLWWATVITAAGSVCMAVTAPIWGILSDRVGRKPMVIRAMLFATLTIGLMSIATAPWQVFGLRLIEGAFTGTVTACAALVAATVPRDRVGFGLGLIQTSVFSGSSLGPLFGGFLAGQIGYRWTFFTASLFMAAGVVIVLLLVEERFQPVRRVATAGRRAGVRAGFRAPLAILAVPVVGIMVVTMLVSRGTSMALQPILPLYVAELGGMGLNDAETAGLILGAQGLTSAIASIYFGRLGDRIGHRKILTVCTFAAGFIYLPMAIATQSWQLLILQAAFGVAAGGLVPTANALVANATDPRQRGVVFGLMAGAGSLGAFVGPLAIAGLTTSGGFGLAFLAIGLSLLLTGIAIVYTFSHRARELPGAGRPATGD